MPDRQTVHTQAMALPALSPQQPPDPDVDERLPGLLETAQRVWSSSDERRRMRAFGWRPAVEEGVLKREWHGLNVRVSRRELLAERPGAASISWRAAEHRLACEPDVPIGQSPELREVLTTLLGLIGAYERWVEAREGRRERVARAKAGAPSDRRTVNALAETRRLQRLLQTPSKRRSRG